MNQPEFLTNDQNNKVSDGINSLLSNLIKLSNDNLSLDISTAYLNPGGFSLLEDSLNKVNNVRILLGADPDLSTSKLRPLKDEFTDINTIRLSSALEGQKRNMEEDRNLLGFTFKEDESAKRMIHWLKNPNVNVRRYQKGFLHGKAWIISNPTSSVIAGSSNFTFAGLSTNIELNLGQYQPGVVKEVQNWFDKIWEESETFDLTSLFNGRYEEHFPYLIYLRMLWEKYGNEIEEERKVFKAGITLTSFQEDGIARARKILSKNNGVLIADGVGLGKSFIAAALMREALIELRQRVLLIAPASLRDGPWRTFQNRHADFHFECISFEQLRDAMDPDKKNNYLNNPINEYSMIVIDEAHAFRNPNTSRSIALQKILQGLPSKKLVLLTATPVNNSIWDLYYELSYFLKNDSIFVDKGIKSIRAHFKEIAAKDPESLSPKDLFDILDHVAVRRTRHFIKKYYSGDTIDVDGFKETIKFPEPIVRRIDYNLKKILPNFFDELQFALDADIRDSESFRIPNNKIGVALSLARYIPSSYLSKPSLKPNEIQISGLILSGLLKRFESSSIAFAKTCLRMAESNGEFIKALDKGIVLQGENLVEWMSTDTDDIDSYLKQGGEGVSSTIYNHADLRKAVKGDKGLLDKWANIAESVTPENDPKLEKLMEELVEIAKVAKDETITEKDYRNNRKTIIFSYYIDTSKWIYNYLLHKTKTDPRLAIFKNRITMVSGMEQSRETSVFGFAPESTESPTGEDLYDILVCTDVLSEGVNLQQARNIINYDLPWNPMKLVQRHGRIDRIGSPHNKVFLNCFFPDTDLENLLGLEHRIKLKLAAASAGVGVENEVIPESKSEDINFSYRSEEIEKLRRENPELFMSAGENGDAVSGEEYRQNLRQGLQNPKILSLVKDLAWGSGSGKATNGKIPGYVFCAKIANKTEPVYRFISYDHENNPQITDDTLTCLSQAYSDESTARKIDDKTYSGAYDAWSIAKEDIYRKWEFLTHPKNIQQKIPKVMNDAIAILRKCPPDTMNQENIEKSINSLESDYGVRIQRRIRESILIGKNDQEKSNNIASIVKEIGLEASDPPKPLPRITEEDINLLCWIAIS